MTGEGRWTDDEHAIFMSGLRLRPKVSWKSIAAMVGTRTARQTRTHAQKYYQKLERRRKRNERLNKQQGGLKGYSEDAQDLSGSSDFVPITKEEPYMLKEETIPTIPLDINYLQTLNRLFESSEGQPVPRELII